MRDDRDRGGAGHHGCAGAAGRCALVGGHQRVRLDPRHRAGLAAARRAAHHRHRDRCNGRIAAVPMADRGPNGVEPGLDGGRYVRRTRIAGQRARLRLAARRGHRGHGVARRAGRSAIGARDCLQPNRRSHHRHRRRDPGDGASGRSSGHRIGVVHASRLVRSARRAMAVAATCPACRSCRDAGATALALAGITEPVTDGDHCGSRHGGPGAFHRRGGQPAPPHRTCDAPSAGLPDRRHRRIGLSRCCRSKASCPGS